VFLQISAVCRNPQADRNFGCVQRALPFRKRRHFRDLCPKASENAIDLMQKCLTFSPKKRLTVEQALEHPYLEVSRSAAASPDRLPGHINEGNRAHDPSNALSRSALS
jgi:serine/threonine protein kinase